MGLLSCLIPDFQGFCRKNTKLIQNTKSLRQFLAQFYQIYNERNLPIEVRFYGCRKANFCLLLLSYTVK